MAENAPPPAEEREKKDEFVPSTLPNQKKVHDFGWANLNRSIDSAAPVVPTLPLKAASAAASHASASARDARSPRGERTPLAAGNREPSRSHGGDVSVRVVCRLRPMSEREKTVATVPVATSTERREVVVARRSGGRQVSTAFNFDGVLGPLSTQEDVFNTSVRPLVDQVLSGYDATAFAYGQTGTGKTYTMEGDPEEPDGAGLMPRAAVAVLDALSDAKYTKSKVTISYLEIYNEELSDLLAAPYVTQKPEIMDQGGHRGVCCVGLSEVPVKTLEDITQRVKVAQERRRMAETRMNSRSSRSHCIFTMKVRCWKQVLNGKIESVGKLHLVDLAGSECAKKATFSCPKQAAAQGPGQERERRNINQSLATLGRVIGALRAKSVVPYRDSKLTRILKDALGGNCKTVFIATISPALVSVGETISTLTYAEEAIGIQNKPVATSFLQMTDMPNGESRDKFSGSSISGCSTDWSDVEMKIMHLTQEVEEAQAALARQDAQQQEYIDRAKVAEQEAAELSATLASREKALTEAVAKAEEHLEKSRLAEERQLELQAELDASRASEAKLRDSEMTANARIQAADAASRQEVEAQRRAMSDECQRLDEEVARVKDMMSAECKKLEEELLKEKATLTEAKMSALRDRQRLEDELEAEKVKASAECQKLEDLARDSLTEMANEKAAMKEEIQMLGDELFRVKEESSTLEHELLEHKTGMIAVNQNMVEERAALEGCKQIVTDIKADRDSLQEQLAGKTKLLADMKALQDEMHQNFALEKKSIQDELQQHNALEKMALQDKLQGSFALESDMMTDKLIAIEADRSSLEQELIKRNGAFAALQAEHINLELELTKRSMAQTDLQAEHAEAQSQLTSEIDALHQQLATSQDNHKRRVKDLEKHLNDHKATIADIRSVTEGSPLPRTS